MRKAPGGNCNNEDCVRVSKLTSAVPVAEVGEPPDVAESNGKTEAGEEKLDRTVPVATIQARGVLGTSTVLRTAVGAEEFLTEEGVILPQTSLILQISWSLVSTLTFIKENVIFIKHPPNPSSLSTLSIGQSLLVLF